ncbi:uncharacterized protein F5891DRAFT_1125793 [Suillus fuscotomentosus]|uniref:Uncharacterized protein n=1 Tax=Suillus fuscotomentosus TaxID=1912939 RepID=A0AAD4EGL8_9AGAM|nr:uncharacterized protein F5891DRAFT_1125793 [Suillus fuscotomentosus]KAG1905765.1 hypothetical protein F5891DRAFT_1125793 [Suillus fuscotomentosus]
MLPFADHKDLYKTINNIPIGGINWQSFKIQYSREKPNILNVPSCMNQQFDSVSKDEHHYQDFMSGDWAWHQADIIATDPDVLSATFVPIIIGSNKTTVSVGTKNNEYYPLYLSIGNVCNNILEMFKKPMLKPKITHFGDGHYRYVIYGLGPYIANYEEQVLLTSIVRNWFTPHGKLNNEDVLCQCKAHREALFKEDTSDGSIVPFTNNFPQANIHQLIAPDILHQIIKGCFKDHLVIWVEKYLHHVHSKREAECQIDDIDQRLATATPFTGLRLLFKIYLPAIEGHMPTDVVCTFRAFLEFCYLIQRNVITEATISQIQDALCCFHHYHSIFLRSGVVPAFLLPCQHLMKHYPDLICLFRAPNGLCSSMMENKHIKAVKQLWCQSNRYNVLGQMLVMNQRLNKIATLHVDFTKCGMLNGTCLSNDLHQTSLPNADIDDNLDEGEIDNGLTEIEAHVQLAQTTSLTIELSILNIQDLIDHFLFKQLHPHDPHDHATIPLDSFPIYDGKISVVNSASSRFYAPSDLNGIGGMQREHIQSCPKWRNVHACYDCMFINVQPDLEGITSDAPDEDTGMWVVQPSFDGHSPNILVIHIDAIYYTAHLLPVYGVDFIPHAINFLNTLDKFHTFYVNKFADHHAFEIAS